METSDRPHGHEQIETDEFGAEQGQALVEYSLIIVLIVIAALVTLFAFQDSVINGLWGATRTLVDAMLAGSSGG